MIKYLVLDVDGTLTNGSIHIGVDGELFKSFHARDCYSIHQIMPIVQITPIILTGRESKMVVDRFTELGVTMIYQGIGDKAAKLKEIVKSIGCDFYEIGYIGDDLNDYLAMSLCSFKACPSNAAIEIQEICNYISPFAGGDGAVRDISEYIIKHNQMWDSIRASLLEIG